MFDDIFDGLKDGKWHDLEEFIGKYSRKALECIFDFMCQFGFVMTEGTFKQGAYTRIKMHPNLVLALKRLEAVIKMEQLDHALHRLESIET